MKVKLILILLLLTSSLAFSADFEFTAGGSVNLGSLMNFTTAYGSTTEDGFKIGSGLSASGILSLGHHYRVSEEAAVRTISVAVELGYNFYKGERDTIFSTYHNLLIGVLPKLNFNNNMTFGIGAGIYLPLAMSLNNPDQDLIVAEEKELTSFNMDYLKFMYKMPIMPYVKVVWENYIYFTDKWALKVDATALYNLGMVLDTEKLNGGQILGYESYNFSAFSIEVGASISFGRPMR